MLVLSYLSFPRLVSNLSFYFLYYLVIWVSVTKAKPDCNAKDIVLTHQADFDTLVEGCTELGGNVAIAIAYDQINFSGLNRIRGNLFVKDGLREATNFTKMGNPPSRDITLGSIRIDGNFEVSKFGKGLKYGLVKPGLYGSVDVVGNIYIHDSVLSLVRLTVGKVDTFTITDNLDFYGPRSLPLDANELVFYGNTFAQYNNKDPIDTYDLPDITEMGRGINLEANSLGIVGISQGVNPSYAGIRMPKLRSAPEIYIKEAPVIELPSLQNINSSLELDAVKINTLEFPKLTNIGSDRNGSFIIRDTKKLYKLELPSLETVQGSLTFSGNELLKDIGGLGALRSVLGDVSLSGPIWSISLPSLINIDGSLTISSTVPFNCTTWQDRQIQTRFIKGNFTCDSQTDSAYLPEGFERGSPIPDRSGSEPLTETPSRIPLIAGSAAGGVIAIVGVGLGVFYFRRRPRRFPDLLPGIANPELEANEASLYEIDAKKTEVKAEAPGYIPRIELHGDFEPAEMFVSDTIPAELYGSEPGPIRPPRPAFARDSMHSLESRSDSSSGALVRGGRYSWTPRDEAVFTSNRGRYFRDLRSNLRFSR